SDDGSTLTIDGKLVVDNSGRHEPLTRSGQIVLDAGSHFVVVDYSNEVGDYEIAWLWIRDEGGQLSPVPASILTRRRAEPRLLAAAGALDWISLIAATFAVALALPVVFRPSLSAMMHAARRYPRTACLVLFAALTVIETWPLAAHPRRLSRNDNGDTIFNEWTMAWGAHQMPRDPIHLYDANILYPERDTLAFADSLVVQSAMA